MIAWWFFVCPESGRLATKKAAQNNLIGGLLALVAHAFRHREKVHRPENEKAPQTGLGAAFMPLLETDRSFTAGL